MRSHRPHRPASPARLLRPIPRGWLALAALSLAACAQTTTPTAASRPATSQPAGTRLRLLTYNILGGRNATAVLDNLRQIRPQIVCLQEVNLSEPGVKTFARALGMNYVFSPYHGPNDRTGLAVLTHGEVELLKTFEMEAERSFAMLVRLQIDGQPVYLVNMHLKSQPRPLVRGYLQSLKVRGDQAQALVDELAKYTGPALLAGDSNTLPLTPAYFSLAAAFQDCGRLTGTAHEPTIFVDKVGYRIDHIFVRGPWRVLGSRVEPLLGSDHRPLWADLELAAASQPAPPATQPSE